MFIRISIRTFFKSLNFILFCFALVLLGVIANAQEVNSKFINASVHDLWTQYESGPEHIPFNALQLKTLIPANDKCSGVDSQLDAFLKALQMYGQDSDLSQPQKAKEEVDFLKANLKVLRDSHNPCYETLSSAMLLGSIYASAHENYSKLNSFGGAVQRVTFGEKYPAKNLYQLYLASALLKAHRIRFFKPTFSCQLSQAYFCHSGMIVLDPILDPHDLAGRFDHEMSHFFLDKFGPSPEVTQRFFPDEKDFYKIDWKNFVLLDEALATLTGEAQEVHNQMQSDFKTRLLIFDQKVKSYSIQNDFNLFIKNGPFVELWKNYGQANNSWRWDFGDLLAQTLLSGRLLGDSREMDLLSQIYKNLQKPNFPGFDADFKTLDISDVSHPLNPSHLNGSFAPYVKSLNYWQVSYKEVKEPKLLPWTLQEKYNQNVEVFGIQAWMKTKKSYYELNIQPMLALIATMVDSLKTETPMCQVYNDTLSRIHSSQESNALETYPGGSCKEDETGKAGENGGKTGGGKAGENGGKTGENGGKTDGGAKT